MSMENKTNFIIAVRGYKSVGKEKRSSCTDITALDHLNKKVLLRIIEPLGNEYVSTNDVKNMTEFIKRENYDFAFVVSKKFTENAVAEMRKQQIQHVSDEYMPPFEVEELYSAIVNYANNQCQKKCGKDLLDLSNCEEKKNATLCKIRAATNDAKSHFEQRLIGLLKNDLKVVLALSKP